MSTAIAKPARKRAMRVYYALKRVFWNKRALAIACLVAVFWVAGCGVIYSEMRKPPEHFGHFMMKIPAPVAFLAFPFETMWMRARAGHLNIGDRAPDFNLTKVDHSGQMELAELNRTQPVVLVFGSYT